MEIIRLMNKINFSIFIKKFFCTSYLADGRSPSSSKKTFHGDFHPPFSKSSSIKALKNIESTDVVTCMLSACCQFFASMLPACCQRIASIWRACAELWKSISFVQQRGLKSFQSCLNQHLGVPCSLLEKAWT